MMTGMDSKHCLIALWCLFVAVGCAQVTEEALKVAPTAAEAATDRARPAADSQIPVAASVETPASVASALPAPPPTGREQSTADPSPVTEAQQPPSSAAMAEPSSPVVEQPVIAAAAPAEAEREQGFDLVAPSVAPSAPADELELASLLTRLRKTKAISLRTKLAVKNESDDLFEQFGAYHAEHGTATLAELRQAYDELFGKLYVLLEQADPPLARDIDRSRAAIWAVLADPIEFGAARTTAPQLLAAGRR
jgi:hypothetical protein